MKQLISADFTPDFPKTVYEIWIAAKYYTRQPHYDAKNCYLMAFGCMKQLMSADFTPDFPKTVYEISEC
jgi:hypothetical protein